MSGMIRGIVKTINDLAQAVRTFTGSGLPGQDIEDREYFDHYGMSSRPLEGAEVVMIREGNHILIIASEDRRYRIALEPGEVALYDDQGQRVHLKREGIIEVIAIEKILATTKILEATATTSAKITSPQVEVVAETKVTITSPEVEITGNLAVGGNVTGSGNIQAAGEVADAGGAKTMSGMRAVFDAHIHTGDGGPAPGPTSAPTAGM